MQVAVQGAWGIVPVHLNELSPDEIRATFPGVAYQLGNLLAAINATLQAGIAQSRGGDYSFALALVAGIVAVAVAALAWFGPEARGVAFGRGDKAPADDSCVSRATFAGQRGWGKQMMSKSSGIGAASAMLALVLAACEHAAPKVQRDIGHRPSTGPSSARMPNVDRSR